MRKYLSILFAVFWIDSFSQCVKCNSFEEAFKKPEMVKSIIINGNMHERLASIPAGIGKFVNLEFLYLTDQDIDTIPKEIENLKKLKELSFGGCQLRTIPECIFQLKNLKELVLFSNPFSPEYIQELQLKCLTELPNTKLLMD